VGGVDQQNKSADLAPDWNLWLDLLAVNVSQCAALSLNLDPVKADQAPGHALQQELQRRRLVIGNHADNGGFRVTGRDFDRRTRKREPRLALADFVLWALARSWHVPDPLACRFAASPAPALQEVPAMLSPDLLSITTWARRLADAECPIPAQEPTSEEKLTIAALVVWRPSAPAPGLFSLTAKPGIEWRNLDEVAEWDERAITDNMEVESYRGWLNQAETGHPPYPSPPTILSDGSQVFTSTTRDDPEWEAYRSTEMANAVTALWWEEQLTRAVNDGSMRACDAARAVITHQCAQANRAYVTRDSLAAWVAKHQPFKSVSPAFQLASDSEQAHNGKGVDSVLLGDIECAATTAGASSTSSPAPARTIRTPRRRNPLTAPIELARQKALDPTDPASVWAEFRKLARNPAEKGTLLGVDDEGGTVKYEANNGEVKWIDAVQFSKRLARLAGAG
jgi:hypothetical protein